MDKKVAIVGFACRFPDADSPDQLWENILARRSAFRAIPSERLNSHYFNTDKTATDYIYSRKAAVLKNYTFDRTRFKISNSNYLSADLTHWLALDVADEALRNATLSDLPIEHRHKTGVIIGNTLTGEFSRANLLRLRWPYVQHTLVSTLRQEGWRNDDTNRLLKSFEEKYKHAFPAMEEDSLAGGLSNTIAGRICNYFDFKGGGFTIDGACSSSLLAVSKACEAISNGELSIALVGGVDLSLDPFELVGFSRAGALASKEMLVYDKNSSGFFPGEGCGFIVLTNYDYAKDNELNILGIIKGWGISSDGKGGLTRPSVEGQMLAIERAYSKAGYGIETVSYIEGHGTGTNVGDTTELAAISKSLEKTDNHFTTYISSVKANIGHTKAAAGIAGLIKGLLVINKRIIPPVSGNVQPHSLLANSVQLRLPNDPIILSEEIPIRIGVSSMGFGGINVHVTIEEENVRKKKAFNIMERRLISSYQDAELFLLTAKNVEALGEKLRALHKIARVISIAELSDLSYSLFEEFEFGEDGTLRVAIVAETPEQLTSKVGKILQSLANSINHVIDNNEGIYLSYERNNLKLGLLFPGQGVGALNINGLLLKRFPFIRDLLPSYLNNKNNEGDIFRTDVAQPAIVSTSITACKMLEKLGVSASVSIGHSVGEFSSLYWSGIFSEEQVIALVAKRGELMHKSRHVKGKMLSVALSATDVRTQDILHRFSVSIACINSPNQIVVSGTEQSIVNVKLYCKKSSIAATLLNVENAFHSYLMKKIEEKFFEATDSLMCSEPVNKVYSSVTGQLLHNKEQALINLRDQLTKPVLFYEAFQNARKEDIDVWIEAGCENTLEKIVDTFSDTPVLSMEFSGKTVKGLLKLAGLLFVNNSTNISLLFRDRFYRSLSLKEKIKFITNPCETFTVDETLHEELEIEMESKAVDIGLAKTDTSKKEVEVLGNLDRLVKNELSDKLALPHDAISNDSRMLDDFHLNSLYVGQFLSDIAIKYNLNLTDIPSEYSNATVQEIIKMFISLNKGKSLNTSKAIRKNEVYIEGISSWVYPFEVSFNESPLQLSNKQENIFSNYIVTGSSPFPLSVESVNGHFNEKVGLVIFLYNKDENGVLQLLIESLRLVEENSNITSIVFVQNEQVCNGFAKSWFLEHSRFKIKVITISAKYLTIELLGSEITEFQAFSEVIYKGNKRLIPELTLVLENESRDSIFPSESDVVLFTGGAKGIAFECARQLAIKTKCRLILIGRSRVDKDETVASNLSLLHSQGIKFSYYNANISSYEETAKVISEILLEHGKVTGVVHAAGINNPKKILNLSLADFDKNIKPKLKGFRNLLENLNLSSLKFFFTFGSIIAETGMNGNADYALANEWLRNEVNKISDILPNIRFLNLEWSVWGGTGMGQNLGILESLKKRGINPITLDEGIKFFMDIFQTPVSRSNIIITSRFGEIKTVNKKGVSEGHLYRFVEDIKVFCPNVEIIVDCLLFEHSDLYLKDHIVEEQMIFPAVFGLEAMAQALKVLVDDFSSQLQFVDVKFSKPIIIRKDQAKKIRIIVQQKGADVFSAVIRDDDSSFKVDHFIATLVLRPKENETKVNGWKEDKEEPKLNIDEDFYQSLLFHKGVFKRINYFKEIDAYHCLSYASLPFKPNYFSDFLPKNLILHDPSLSDAVLHGVQVCVPHQTLLPTSIESVSFFNLGEGFANYKITAVEKEQVNEEYTYDIEVISTDHKIICRWMGVKFRALKNGTKRTLTKKLLENVLRRKVDLLVGKKSDYRIKFVLNFDKATEVLKRVDGKPIALNGHYYSKAKSLNQTLEVEANANIACDIQNIPNSSTSTWQTLLGESRFQLIQAVQDLVQEEVNSSATRVWSVIECLRKVGLFLSSPLIISHCDKDGTVYFKSGENIIMTYICGLKETGTDTAFAILIDGTR